jgi:ABC-type arginine/histidine transport system permease subunit
MPNMPDCLFCKIVAGGAENKVYAFDKIEAGFSCNISLFTQIFPRAARQSKRSFRNKTVLIFRKTTINLILTNLDGRVF